MPRKDVFAKISDGDYTTKLLKVPYRKDPKADDAWIQDSSRLREQFNQDCLIELGRLTLEAEGKEVFRHSKANRLVELAWENGNGFLEVWNMMIDLDDLLS